MTSTEPGVGHLPEQFSDDDRMQVSPEAIRRRCSRRAATGCAGGSTACLRTGRALHRPRRRVDTRATRRIADMVPIGGRLAEAEAEAEDRAVPGYQDGDLILGAHGTSSSSTLVERSTRSVMSLYDPMTTAPEPSTPPSWTTPPHCPRCCAAHRSGTKASNRPGTPRSASPRTRRSTPAMRSRLRTTRSSETPAEALARLLSAPRPTGVATASGNPPPSRSQCARTS